MAEIAEPWKNVASKAEALGLKLKLHLEQERDAEDTSTEPGATNAVIEDLGRKLQETFDSLGSAAKDPAVRSDFKDMGSLFKEALTDTFSSVSSDVGDAMRKTTARSDGDTAASDGADSETSDDNAADKGDSAQSD